VSTAKPLSREKRLANYGEPLTPAQSRQLRKTDLRREHDRPRKQRSRVADARRRLQELWK
jgi:hypothetical protein